MSKVRIVRVSVLDRDGYSSDMTEGELATLMHRQPQALVVAEIQCAREWRRRPAPTREGSHGQSRTTSRSPKRPERRAA